MSYYFNVNPVAREREAARRAAFNEQVQAGRTAHGTVRSLSREEIAALYPAAALPKPEPKFIPPKAAKPRPERKVIKLPPKPRKKPAPTIRARVLALMGDGTVRSVAQINEALSDVNRGSLCSELKECTNTGSLRREKLGFYRIATAPERPRSAGRFVASVDSVISKIAEIFQTTDGTLSAADIRAALPNAGHSTIRRDLAKLFALGEIERVSYGAYRRGAVQP